MAVRRSMDDRLDEAIVLLHRVLAELGSRSDTVSPWQESYLSPPQGGRLSATDRLSMWFRPAPRGATRGIVSLRSRPILGPGSSACRRRPARPGISRRPPSGTRRRLLRRRRPAAASACACSSRSPSGELDTDAESVVGCLYDLVHAVGRGDVEAAVACVAPDYHALEDDREIDRDGLAWQFKRLLESLRGWRFETSLVEIRSRSSIRRGLRLHGADDRRRTSRRPGAANHPGAPHRRLQAAAGQALACDVAEPPSGPCPPAAHSARALRLHGIPLGRCRRSWCRATSFS